MVKMLNGGKAVRDPDGKIVKAAAFQGGEKDVKPGRVAPDRRWFGEPKAILTGSRSLIMDRQYSSHLSDCFGSLQDCFICSEGRSLLGIVEA